MALEVFPSFPPFCCSYFEDLFTLSYELVGVISQSVSETLPSKVSFSIREHCTRNLRG